METNVAHECDGKKYNQYGQQVIECALCDKGTTALGTKLCDSCFELDSRIYNNLDIAERLVKYYRKNAKNKCRGKFNG
jgi:hypothetical protein